MTTNTTSKKHLNIISEPLGDKMIGELAGISQVLGERMAAKGFDKVVCKCIPVGFLNLRVNSTSIYPIFSGFHRLTSCSGSFS